MTMDFTRQTGHVVQRTRRPYTISRKLLGLYAGALLAILYMPLVIVAILSFSETGSMSFPIGEPTVRWYSEVLSNPVLLSALGRSLGLGIVSSIIATTFALLLALGFRHDTWIRPYALGLVLLPLLLPGVVGGAVLFVFFGIIGAKSGIWSTVLVAHVVYLLPFAYLTISPRLHGFNRSIEEAAADLGARPSAVFRLIVWPMIRPAAFATALFAFTLSFDEFIRTLFVTGFDRTVPVLFWVTITEQGAPFLPAMAVIIMLISIISSATAFALTGRGDAAKY